MSHFIKICIQCSKVMNQCRCFSKEKAVLYDTCEGCRKSLKTGFDNSVNRKQIEYIRKIDCALPQLKDRILEHTLKAATVYEKAGYSGSHGDGGASKIISNLESYIQGYRDALMEQYK
jgi:hypothetical protein